MGGFIKKSCAWVYYKWVIIKNQTVKVVLDLPNYATKKELDRATSFGTSDLAVKKDFITLKAKFYKLDINKLVNIPTSLNNLKTKVDD